MAITYLCFFIQQKVYCVLTVSDTVSSIADTASVLVEGADSKIIEKTYQVVRNNE